ncbi:MAG: hypothetical protein GY732_01655, partial [Gammaproteobacteria bacterium]|nr:hypothetical protein [Gammaproteobacteria bacterium]
MKYLLSIFVVLTLLVILSISASAQQTVPSQTPALVAPAAQNIPVLKVRAVNKRSPRRSGKQPALDIEAKERKSESPPKLGADQYQKLTNPG